MSKETVDNAIRQDCPSIKNIIVFKNSDEGVSFNPNIDLWWHDILPKSDQTILPEVMSSEDILFILYTSGSTGKPKGIIHTSAGYLLNCILTNKWVFDLKKMTFFGVYCRYWVDHRT